MSTTIRELLTVLGVETDTKELAAFDAKVGSAKDAMGAAATAAAVLTGAVVATTAAIAGIIASTVAAGGAIDDAAQRTALTAREFQTLGFAAAQGGASVEQFETALKGLTSRSAAAAKGGKDYIELVDGMRLSLVGANGEALTQAQLMAQLADKVASVTSQQQRLAIASAALGEEGGARLVPMLSAGAAGLDAMAERAEALGLVMSDDLVAGSAELGDRLDEVTGIIGGLRNAIAERLIPVANDLLRQLIDWYEANGRLIRQRLDWWAERLANGMRMIGAGVAFADAIVQRVLGGWAPILFGIAGGVALVSAGVTALAGLKAWVALKAGLVAISALVTAVAAGLGIGFWPAVVVIGAVAAAVGVAAAGVAALVAFVEDLVVYFQGGNSAIGTFIERNREAEGALGGLARWLEANVEELRALGDLLEAVAGKMWEAFGPGITTAINLMSSALQTLVGWITAAADAFVGAKLDERAAATGERVSFIRGLTASINGDTGAGPSAAVGPGALAGGNTSRSNSVTNQVQVTVGAEARGPEVEEAVRRALEFGNRQTMAALAGAEV